MVEDFIEEVGQRTNAKLLSLQAQIDAIIAGLLPGSALIKKVSLTAADIKTLNSVPIVAVDIAATPGKTLVCISAYYDYQFNTAAFTSNTIAILNATAAAPQALSPVFLTNVANDSETFNVANGGLGINVVNNQSLMLVANADSAVGDCTVDVFIIYQVQTP